MTIIAPGIGRVPNLLINRTTLSALNRTNLELLDLNGQLSTGLRISRPSQDPVAAATIAELDARLERSEQIRRNLSFAASSLGVLDGAIGEATSLAQEALGLALENTNVGPSATDRASQALVVDSLLEGLFRVSSETSPAGFVFGGSRPGLPPVEFFQGGFRFTGERGGLVPDLGAGRTIPITVGASNAVGAVSARVQGSVDLDPGLTAGTRLSDLNGARGFGVSAGTVEVVINGTDVLSVDLSGAATAGDVADQLTAAIRAFETSSGTTVLPGPDVGVAPGGFTIAPDVAVTVEVRDIPGGSTAADLGLARGGLPFTNVSTQGDEVDPRLTPRSTVASLRGLAGPLGELVIENNGRTETIDLSAATTVSEVISAIEATNIGVKAEVGPDGTSLNVVNTVSNTRGNAMAVIDSTDGTQTASLLGVRSFAGATRVSDLNFGGGVGVVSGETDPELNIDFEVVLTDPLGPPPDPLVIAIDLSPGDVTGTTADLLASINGQIDAALTAAGRPTTDVSVGFVDGQNGLVFQTDAGVTDVLSLRQRNNSPALDDLGLFGVTFDTATQQLIGSDVARVRPDNLFSSLLDLAEALRTDDTRGITVAGESLEMATDRLIDLRARVGADAERVDDETARQDDRELLDLTIRSELRDTDFTAAATRFSLLQTQLEAGLRVSSVSQQLSLLDFI